MYANCKHAVRIIESHVVRSPIEVNVCLSASVITESKIQERVTHLMMPDKCVPRDSNISSNYLGLAEITKTA